MLGNVCEIILVGLIGVMTMVMKIKKKQILRDEVRYLAKAGLLDHSGKMALLPGYYADQIENYKR